jgi:hypothetical protein
MTQSRHPPLALASLQNQMPSRLQKHEMTDGAIRDS